VSQQAQKVGFFPSTILLAIDGSEETELATRKAVDLANTTGSELHLLTISKGIDGADAYTTAGCKPP
jgi:nucleotide-binding universal stress UspA family protein